LHIFIIVNKNQFMNPVFIFIPVAAAIVLFFIFRPSKKEKPTVDVMPTPSDPVFQVAVNEEMLAPTEPAAESLAPATESIAIPEPSVAMPEPTAPVWGTTELPSEAAVAEPVEEVKPKAKRTKKQAIKK
jgi:hypothetical protein